MVIYIPVEIAVRELPGHLLLSAIAASRGHEVLLASPDDIWLYNRCNLIGPGAILVKNVNVPSGSQRAYDSYIRAGCHVYCHEQEASILWGDFRKFLKDYNITEKQYFPFKKIFCWGERDTEGYAQFFPQYKNRFINTGSPRAELWTPRFKALLEDCQISALSPYILVVTNFSWLMGRKHMSEWLLDQIDLELLNSVDREQNLFDYIEEDYVIALRIIMAVKHLSHRHPSVRIVVRPHPIDNREYWTHIFKNNENITIAPNTDSISGWIANASVVIQNGCTSAVEAAIQGIPIISYGPDRNRSDLTIPNSLGFRARDLQELDTAVRAALNGSGMQDLEGGGALLRLINLEQCASSRIVAEMEVEAQSLGMQTLTKSRLVKMRLLRSGKSLLDRGRRKLGTVSRSQRSHKLNFRQAKAMLERICVLKGVRLPAMSQLSTSGFVIRAA
jgi:surface carbohydrate biosynthesis protein